MPSKRPKGTRIKEKNEYIQFNRLAIESRNQRYLQVTNRQDPHPPHKTTLHDRGQEKKTKESKRKQKKMMVKKKDRTIWDLAIRPNSLNSREISPLPTPKNQGSSELGDRYSTLLGSNKQTNKQTNKQAS